jgi:hypothetical protein
VPFSAYVDREDPPVPHAPLRYVFYAVVGSRFVTVQLTGHADGQIEHFTHALLLSEVVAVKVNDDGATMDLRKPEGTYEVSIPIEVANQLIEAPT